MNVLKKIIFATAAFSMAAFSTVQAGNPVAVLNVAGTPIASNSASELQYKAFTFPLDQLKVEGWFYTSFKFTLQRLSPDGAKPSGHFIADFSTLSNGRHSAGPGAIYSIVLMSKGAPQREIYIGTHHVPGSPDTFVFQDNIPNDPQWATGFPLAFFDSIDQVVLKMRSEQDSN